MDLVEILKLSKKATLDLFSDLLNQICKKFPAEDSSRNGEFVRVSCSCGSDETSLVSTQGFLLLEAAEGAMKSTEQKVEMVVVDHLRGRLLSALASRMDRQKDDVDTRVVVRLSIQCDDKKSALDVCSVLQHSFVVDLDGRLVVSGDIEMEGWTALKEALACGRLHDISRLDTICKRYTTSARREDLWAIWRCLSLSWYFSEDLVVFDKVKGEKRRWIALEEFLDTDYSLIPVTP